MPEPPGTAPALRPVAVIGDDVIHVRSLDESERDEVERWSRLGPVVRDWWLMLLLVGLALLTLVAASPMAVGLTIAAIISFLRNRGWRLISLVRERLQLRRDRSEGELLVIRSPSRHLEFLPHSRALWTVNGEPARWRSPSG